MKALSHIWNHVWNSVDHSFDFLWSKLAPILPKLALVVLVLIVGLWLAHFLSDFIASIIKKSKIGDLIDKHILVHVNKVIAHRASSVGLISGTIKWFLIANVLLAALDLAGLRHVIDFVNNTLGYFPNIIASVLIVLVGSLLSSFAGTVVSYVSKKDAHAATARVAVSIFAFIAALGQLITPIVALLNKFVAQLSLSSLQANVLFIGVIVLALYASKDLVAKTVTNLYKI